jgi:hypothetical protein
MQFYHEMTALRKWKDQTFGSGGDPRLAVLLRDERQKVREKYVEPILKQRKLLMNLKRRLQTANRQKAQEVRKSL